MEGSARREDAPLTHPHPGDHPEGDRRSGRAWLIHRETVSDGLGPGLVEPAPPSEPVPVEMRVSPVELYARAEARAGAPWRGVIAAGEPFEVHAHLASPGCGDWGEVALGAWACLDGTTLPPAGSAGPPPVEGDLGWVYARRGRDRPGPIYTSREAFEAGRRPVDHFEAEHSYAFVRVEPTAKGEVLVAADGRVVPVALAALYEPSPFTGRDLIAEPLPEGSTLAWCVTPTGCGGPDGAALEFQAAFLVEGTATGTIRTWRPGSRPEGVGEAERWVDVHLAEQTLTVWVGDQAEFVTLVSAGTGGRHATPKGVYRVQDKYVENDMLSLPGAADVYHVERVPWVLHFRPRFALHGAYWHGRFGIPMSHGCVNLSPADAHRVFDLLEPELPNGWRVSWATADHPGTLIRVR